MEIHAVGLLSPGDMGHVVGQLLLSRGMPVITCLKGRSARTRKLAKKAGVEDVETYERLVQNSDLILSILVPSEAENAAKVVAQALRSSKEKVVYVDCNAIAPETAKAIGNIISEAGSLFVDAGIIGSPPRREGATRFYASGKDAKEFEKLRKYGLDVRIAGSEVGQASGLKMCYAALTKGIAALSTELLVAAQRMGLYKALISEFQLSQIERYVSMEQGLPSMPTKAKRWVGEMEEIAKTFEDVGLTPKIYQGAADIYRFVGETKLADETPETLNRSRRLFEMIEVLAKGGNHEL